ncbi:hypothetical protein RRG08_013022 [Elysia crispata]|uniref:Uncharacterized protein n=1 Tax=Elysia crispata TaxID=231223 RepID=A0AAE1A1F9_9GAST|nr:hypothetical protein RRG08_013022 [Elysia crispata]
MQRVILGKFKAFSPNLQSIGPPIDSSSVKVRKGMDTEVEDVYTSVKMLLIPQCFYCWEKMDTEGSGVKGS